MTYRKIYARGFTLIEAVMAVAIISVCALALLTAASQCTLVARANENYHAAVAVLDLGELEHPLVMTNEVFENEVDEYEPLENGFVFTRTVSEIEDEEDMFLVQTKVSWAARGRQSFEEVETYIYSTNHP